MSKHASHYGDARLSDELRAELRRRIAKLGMQRLAAELGSTPTTLEKAVSGALMQGSSREHLIKALKGDRT